MGLIYTVTNRNFSLFRGLFTTLFGLALLIWPQQFPQLIVRIIAGFSLLAGLFTLITLAERVKRTGERGIVSTLGAINALIYFVFGALIFIFPGFFISILTFFLGALLLLIGASQLMNLIFSARHANVPVALYIIALLLLICGIALFFNPFNEGKYLMLFFGAVMLVYGISEFISAWKLRNIKFTKEGEFVEYEEVKEQDQLQT